MKFGGRNMAENCNSDCANCAVDCDERTEEQMDFSEKAHELSDIKKVIGVVSGKGGVGKSLVTSLMAVLMNRRGYSTAILDADVTGPSIPKTFGVTDKATGSEMGIFPVKSNSGINLMSINMLLENDTDPVIWRGPIIAGTVKQFWTDVIWGDVDYMFIDMPPGTGDVPLTVFQSIPVDGIIIVTSPQELVSMIVSKARKMAERMNIPILGIVENMSYFKCPSCDDVHHIFGDSHIDQVAGEGNLEVIAKLPIDPKLARACDRGMIELFEGDWLDRAADIIEGKETHSPSEEASEEDKLFKTIAVASHGDTIAGHFGHCENFNIYKIENNEIVEEKSLPNPGHKPGFLPNYLNEQGVDIIMSGGIGQSAVDIFNEKGIAVISGVEGSSREAVVDYINNRLAASGEICQDHK